MRYPLASSGSCSSGSLFLASAYSACAFGASSPRSFAASCISSLRSASSPRFTSSARVSSPRVLVSADVFFAFCAASDISTTSRKASPLLSFSVFSLSLPRNKERFRTFRCSPGSSCKSSASPLPSRPFAFLPFCVSARCFVSFASAAATSFGVSCWRSCSSEGLACSFAVPSSIAAATARLCSAFSACPLSSFAGIRTPAACKACCAARIAFFEDPSPRSFITPAGSLTACFLASCMSARP